MLSNRVDIAVSILNAVPLSRSLFYAFFVYDFFSFRRNVLTNRILEKIRYIKNTIIIEKFQISNAQTRQYKIQISGNFFLRNELWETPSWIDSARGAIFSDFSPHLEVVYDGLGSSSINRIVSRFPSPICSIVVATRLLN